MARWRKVLRRGSLLCHVRTRVFSCRSSLLTLRLESWNELAITMLVNDYNGFNFERDFPSVYKSVINLSSPWSLC